MEVSVRCSNAWADFSIGALECPRLLLSLLLFPFLHFLLALKPATGTTFSEALITPSRVRVIVYLAGCFAGTRKLRKAHECTSTRWPW